MFEKYRHKEGFGRVPVSGNQYFINLDGEIKGVNGMTLPQLTDDDGDRVVWADLWDGVQYYKVALLSIVKYKCVKLPFQLWKHITPLFIDGDRNNLHPSNLAYRFPEGGLECAQHPGFYYIPMYTGYAIGLDGNVLRVGNPNVKTWTVGKKHTYRHGGLGLDVGGYSNAGRHRLLCLAFKPYEGNVDKLDVNHLDGVPGNDWLDNLEWATRRRNILHMHELGLSRQSTNVLMKDLKTGDVVEYFSFAEAGRQLGLSEGTVRLRIITGGQKVYDGHRLFKLSSDTTPWRAVNNLQKESKSAGIAHDLLAKNVHTGDVVLYVSVGQCSAATGVKPATISYKLNQPMSTPVGGYLFKWVDNDVSWPEYTDLQLACFKKYPNDPPRPVRVVDLETNKERFYLSRVDAAQEMGVTRDAITDSINRACKIQYRYKAFNV